jgi:hypothetical protein
MDTPVLIHTKRQDGEYETQLVDELVRLNRSIKGMVEPLRMFMETTSNAKTGDISMAIQGFKGESKKLLSESILEVEATSRMWPSDKKFIPSKSIKDVVTKDTVEMELGYWCQPQVPADAVGLVDFIVDRAPKLFTICIMVNLSRGHLISSMKGFQRKGICDSNLPFDDRFQSRPDVVFSAIDPETITWDSRARASFMNQQWKVLAPKLRTDESGKSMAFKYNHIIPFVERDDRVGGVGGFGTVFRAVIHPQHLEDRDGIVSGPPPGAARAGLTSYRSSEAMNMFSRSRKVKRWARKMETQRKVRGSW